MHSGKPSLTAPPVAAGDLQNLNQTSPTGKFA